MKLPRNKTKIVCTIGPASSSPTMIERLLKAGMNIARLNFSHGSFEEHQEVIEKLRAASEKTGKRLAIMADLPGPKMRIGELDMEPVELVEGDSLILTTRDMVGNKGLVSITLDELPGIVKEGDKLFLNDGLISLLVKKVVDQDVHCEVRSGGELRSRKGLNLPGIDLGMSAFTKRDRECLEFAAKMNLDAVSQSFVSHAGDIHDLRKACEELDYAPFIIAKIERCGALSVLDEILEATDGLMVARGDLGVETSISRMAVIQKEIMMKANQAGKPVITATQMLESMTDNRRPTRAEATDVANAILDGTDAVMLSGESAMGKYPVDAVAMLAEIAAETEPSRKPFYTDRRAKSEIDIYEVIAQSLMQAIHRIKPKMVIVPTRSGHMARAVTRHRVPEWINALSICQQTCQQLQFSYGVNPVLVDHEETDWLPFVVEWVKEHGVKTGYVILSQGPSPDHPAASHKMEILDLTAAN